MYDTSIKYEEIKQAVEDLKSKFNKPEFSFEIIEIAGGVQFLTKPEYQLSLIHI